MPFCIRCVPIKCSTFLNLTSISVSTRGNFKTIEIEDCKRERNSINNPPIALDMFQGISTSSNETNNQSVTIKGPIVGTITVTAYAFTSGQDLWNNSRCEGTAQSSQNVMQKQDYFTDSSYLIPLTSANSQITGDIGTAASMDNVAFTTEDFKIQNNNGLVIGTRTGVDVGSQLTYMAGPLNFSMPNNNNFYNVLGFDCSFLTSFSYSVNYPTQVATASYTFQFIRPGNKNNAGTGNGLTVIDLNPGAEFINPFSPIKKF